MSTTTVRKTGNGDKVRKSALENLKDFTALGTNVAFKQEGDILYLAVDITRRNGASASGKTTIVGSTNGNQKVNGITVGLNAYVK